MYCFTGNLSFALPIGNFIYGCLFIASIRKAYQLAIFQNVRSFLYANTDDIVSADKQELLKPFNGFKLYTKALSLKLFKRHRTDKACI